MYFNLKTVDKIGLGLAFKISLGAIIIGLYETSHRVYTFANHVCYYQLVFYFKKILLADILF